MRMLPEPKMPPQPSPTIYATSGKGQAGLTALERHQAVCNGLPASTIERLKNLLGLTDKELESHLSVSAKTIARLRKSDQGLSPAASDRAARLFRIYDLAVRTLENEEAARRWLNKPNYGLGDMRPIDLVKTDPGAQKVAELLDRIEYGVMA